MSSDNPNPEQAQAKIATALGRLRGDVMPPITSQAAPRLSDQIGAAPLPTASAWRADPALAPSNPPLGNYPLGPVNPPPANANPPAGALSAAAPTPMMGSLGNNASGTGYLGNVTNPAAKPASQPDLLAGV